MQRLKELRKDAGLTLKQVSASVGMAESTISMYENGKHEPDYSTLIRFANLYNTSVDYLIGRTDQPHPPTQLRITEDEKQLIRIFRSLNTQGRHALLSTASIVAGNPDMQKEPYASAEIS